MAGLISRKDDFALGHFYLFARGFEDSLAEFDTALRLNPNFARSHKRHVREKAIRSSSITVTEANP